MNIGPDFRTRRLDPPHLTAVNTHYPVIIVNGLPAAGKTTLARTLAATLRLPLFSKDTIKEAHADALGTISPDGRPQREWSHLLGTAAITAMLALLADTPGGAVLESTFGGAEQAKRMVSGLLRVGVTKPLQVWCDVPLEVAKSRSQSRQGSRHPIHGPGPNELEWQQRWARVVPLPIEDTLLIDTTRAVDVTEIAEWIKRTGARGASRS